MSHQKKHQLPPHARRRQQTAEQSLRRYPGKTYRGGPETLDVRITSTAPLWEDGHGLIEEPATTEED